MNERSLTTTSDQSASRFPAVRVLRSKFTEPISHASDYSGARAEKNPDFLMLKPYSVKESHSVAKKKILAVARNLFWEHGYSGVSMRDLAKAYGCRPANLYNYFSTKEAILFEVLLEEMEQIIGPISHLEEAEDDDPVEQLRFIISSHLRVTLSHRRSAKMLFDVALGNLSLNNRKVIISMRDTYDRVIRKVVQRGQEQGVFLPYDKKLVGFMISSMITRSRIWFRPNKGVTVDELAGVIFQFALKGILTPKGSDGA